MNEADSIMELHADSALQILQSIDSAQIGDVSQQAKYSLLMTQARVKNNLVSLADTAALPYLEYCYRHGTDYDRMRAAFYTGWLYYQYQDYVKAVRHLNLARDIAQICDNHYWLAKIYEAKADIYGLNGLDDDAVRNRMKARDNYKLAGKTLNADYSVCDLSMDYRHVGNLDESARLLDSLLQMNESGNSISAGLHCYILRQQAILNLEMSEYERADSCLRMQDSIAGGAYDYYGTLRVLTAIAVRQNQPEQDSLLSVYKSVMSNGSDSAYYYGLKRAAERVRKNHEQADLYADSMIIFQNSEVSRVLRQSVLREEFEIQKGKTEVLGHDNKKLFTAIVFLVIAVFLVVLFFRLRIVYLRRKTDRQIQSVKDMLLQYMYNEEVSRAENIESSRESEECEINPVLLLYRDYMRKLLKICHKYESERQKGNVGKEYKQIKEVMKFFGSKDELLRIESAINSSYGGILDKLKDIYGKQYEESRPTLILLLAGFIPPVISSILDENINTVYTRRMRLIARLKEMEDATAGRCLLFFS